VRARNENKKNELGSFWIAAERLPQAARSSLATGNNAVGCSEQRNQFCGPRNKCNDLRSRSRSESVEHF
jgi:hypothetical protein